MRIFFLLFIFFKCFNQNAVSQSSIDAKPDFIIISNMRSGDRFFFPILISTGPIEKIITHESNFQQAKKFSHFTNVIISEGELEAFYNFLKIHKNLRVREQEFPWRGLFLIIDCRIDGEDYELHTFNEIETTFFILKILYCFGRANISNNDFNEQIESLYRHYLRYEFSTEEEANYPREFICE